MHLLIERNALTVASFQIFTNEGFNKVAEKVAVNILRVLISPICSFRCQPEKQRTQHYKILSKKIDYERDGEV